jgi:hypothetical protein
MRYAYGIVPSGDQTTIRTPPTWTTMGEARKVSAQFRGNSEWKRVARWRTDQEQCPIIEWRRDPNGKGRRWFSATV